MTRESSPLLGTTAPEEEDLNFTDAGPGSSNTKQKSYFPTSFKAVGIHVRTFHALYLIAVFALIIDTSFMMIISPMARMTELGICREYYRKHDPSAILPGGDVPELLCKVDKVQEKLATVNGILTSIGAIPSLVCSLPYGILADKYGRRFGSALGVIGLSLGFLWYYLVLEFYETLPFAAVYAYPVFFIIGGGGVITSALIQAMIADVTPRELRARVYFLIHCTVISTVVFGPPFGAWLMKITSPSWAFLASIPIRLVSLFILYLIPETRTTSEPVLTTPPSPSDHDSEGQATPPPKERVRMSFRKLVNHVEDDVLPILSKLPVVMGLVSMVVNNFAVPIVGITIQYMSARFKWLFEDTSYILSFQATIQVVLLTTLLPMIDHYLKNKHNSPEKANLIMSRYSVIFLVLGMIFVGLAPSAAAIFPALFIFTCGSGYAPALRSYMTSLVQRDETALLFTLIGVFDSIGSMAGAPLLAMSFKYGISKGGLLFGLPFFCAAAIYAFSGISIWLLRPPSKDYHDELEAESASLVPVGDD